MIDRNATANSLIAALDNETAWGGHHASERVDLSVRSQLEAAASPAFWLPATHRANRLDDSLEGRKPVAQI